MTGLTGPVPPGLILCSKCSSYINLNPNNAVLFKNRNIIMIDNPINNIIVNLLVFIINKKGHPLRVKDTYIWSALQGLSTETVYLHHSTNAEGMHYSSWEVSCESQSFPLRFFVESNATDHQARK